MSNYDPTVKASDMSSGKGSEETSIRRESGLESGLRQQLPPLSSLFGPPSQMFSQTFDRPSPYASTSPLDHPLRPSHDIGRDYTFGSRDQQMYHSPAHRFSFQLPGSRDGDRMMEFRGEQHSPQTPQNPPATPTSSVGSEAPPAKDGLGPKIWTGTHFLPRFVRAAEVPGEGMCYFYDDGSHCKTVIDGEAVNAHWGVTKAGKPRKRLAIACVTCREKKIKCDPDYPRCVQCEKFGRVCKFKNAPRGGHNTSPSTPPAEPEDIRRFAGIARPSSHSSESVSPRSAIRLGSPDLVSSVPRKQARVGYEHYSPTAGRRSPLAPTPESVQSAYSWRQPESLPRIHEDVLRRAWHHEPRHDARV
ncbi:hypothetical protein N0V88_001224 [Collariella sp. IMI 366227]|nr:hypothetical protein N0V88_001224 [Collariella sp. IMI 366227]